MKKIFGFTLSELMIALTVLGILCAAILPAVINTMPNQNKIMIKRSFYNISNIVNDLINNPYLFNRLSNDPNKSDVVYYGFDDRSEVKYNGKTYSGETKFVDLFINSLNYKGDIETDTSYCDFTKKKFDMGNGQIITGNSSTGCRTVTTSDGMRWSFGIPVTSIDSTGALTTAFAAYILVDVNGDKKPNCYQGSESCEGREKDFDQYRVNIYNDGTIVINNDDKWAKNAIKPSTSLTHDD